MLYGASYTCQSERTVVAQWRHGQNIRALLYHMCVAVLDIERASLSVTPWHNGVTLRLYGALLYRKCVIVLNIERSKGRNNVAGVVS